MERRPILACVGVGVVIAGGVVAVAFGPVAFGVGGSASAAESPTHQVLAVTASAEQAPNIAAHAIDGDPATRWSANGVGQWISFDLGDAKPVHAIAIAWHHGDRRVASFDVEASFDMIHWIRVQSTRSSGGTTALERYAVGPTDRRFVRIVGRGNSINAWHSITEVEIYGAG